MTAAAGRIALADIASCFEGVIPSAICTLAEDGTPNVTYLSVVHRIDDEHVALSRQFFNKTEHNTGVNPRAQVTVTEPETGRIFALDLVYDHTETDGPLFERMRTKLDAVAALEGMSNIFRLKGTDVCRVEACRMLPAASAEGLPRRDIGIERVEAVSRRLAEVRDMDELFSAVLDACANLLGYPHVFLMLVDEAGERLYTVASEGFEASGAGSEVPIGEGLIGVAAAHRQSVRLTHVDRERYYSRAVREAAGDRTAPPPEHTIPLPRLASVQSELVTPMLAYHQLVGVICLQSATPGAFQAADECVIGILANQAAMALTATSAPSGAASDGPARSREAAVVVKHYAEDNSVFLDNDYLIKGVAGSILWRLLCVHEEEGRVDFSNREVRLDESIVLPDIKDNLEARLILLRKRLEERCEYLRIERTGRGRFRLRVDRELELRDIGAG